MLLLVRRAAAFAVDALAISIVLGYGFFTATALKHHFGPQTAHGLELGHSHNTLTILAIVALFAVRDVVSNSCVSLGFRLLRLRVRFPSRKLLLRSISALTRAATCFALPPWLATWGASLWASSSDWGPRMSVWWILFALLLVPLSFLVGFGNGLHDEFSRSYVCSRSSSDSEDFRRLSFLRAVASVFVTTTVAATLALTIELASPRLHAQLSDLFYSTRQLSMALPRYLSDGSRRKVVNISEIPGGRYWAVGTDGLIQESTPPKLVEQLNAQVAEWKIVPKTTRNDVDLRDGARLPQGIPYLHLTVLVTREAFEDYFFPTDIARVAGKSLLDENREFEVVLVSLVRTTRIGPQILMSESNIWVGRSWGKGIVMAPPMKNSRLDFSILEFSMGKGQLTPLTAHNN